MGIFDDIPTRSNANDDYVEASWWNIIKQKLQEAFPNVTAVTGDVVGTTDEQTLTNKTFDDELTLKELTGIISTPETGYKKVYPKDDGKLYSLNSDGDEVEIGSGGGAGSKSYFDADSAFFEANNIGSWETDDGAGSAATGLTLSATTTSGEVLEKTTSLKLVKAAADHDGEFIKLASQTIDPIDRGKQLFGSFAFKPISGYVSGDLILEIYDVTNSAVLYSGASEDLELLNVTDPITFNYNAYLESTTAQIELRLKVNNTNTNGFTMTFDEFGFGPAKVLPATFERYEEITLVNSGTQNINGTIKIGRTGNQFALAAELLTHDSASEATSATNAIPAWALPTETYTKVFDTFTGGTLKVQIFTDGRIRLNYFNASFVATARTNSGNNISASYPVPSTPHTMTTNELGLQTVQVNAAGNAGTSLTASVTNIDWVEIEDKFNAWNGTQFVAPRAGKYTVTGWVRFTTSNTNGIYSYINNSIGRLAGFMGGASSAFTKITWSDTLQKGDILSFRSDGDLTLSNIPGEHWIEISSQEDLTLIGAVRNDELIETFSGYTVYAGSAGVQHNLDSIVLTPGEWDLDITINPIYDVSGTAGRVLFGYGTTSGSWAPAYGDSGAIIYVTGVNPEALVGNFEKRGLVVTTPTTYYLKTLKEGAVTNLKMAHKISARRIK